MTGTVTLIRAGGLLPVVPYAYAASVPPDARLVLLAGACPRGPRRRLGRREQGVTVLGWEHQLVELEAAVVDR